MCIRDRYQRRVHGDYRRDMAEEATQPQAEGTDQMVKPTKKISIKRRFVSDGVFLAELNQFFSRKIDSCGYTGVEVRVSTTNTEIRIKATLTKELFEKDKQKVRELTALVRERFNYNEEDNKVSVNVDPYQNRSWSAATQAENIKKRLLSGLPVRVVAHSTLRGIMMRGPKGAEISISGKLRGQRAKTQKYRAGYRVSTGQPKIDFISSAVRHVKLKQGIIGVQVKIMLPDIRDPLLESLRCLPDVVVVREPKDEP
eukprot:TRINITY_DN5662_c0_g1_i8.p2 TRINITY_DN5662_c0_g1~~TRINITY_DN5662_c0_g1_i8.p2  ORF type:complete len:256 (-),score=76.90 TRINITY_DN5662_c0_g1_i8:89-856(-)